MRITHACFLTVLPLLSAPLVAQQRPHGMSDEMRRELRQIIRSEVRHAIHDVLAELHGDAHHSNQPNSDQPHPDLPHGIHDFTQVHGDSGTWIEVRGHPQPEPAERHHGDDDDGGPHAQHRVFHIQRPQAGNTPRVMRWRAGPDRADGEAMLWVEEQDDDAPPVHRRTVTLRALHGTPHDADDSSERVRVLLRGTGGDARAIERIEIKKSGPPAAGKNKIIRVRRRIHV